MNSFRMAIETNSGRKGIKHFNDLNEFVNFMTVNNHKIKAVMEADMPYNDKPVKLPKASTSKGWEQLDASAFGDIDSDGEKGEQILPTGNSGVFKNNASFEFSKSSENADKAETPKIEKSSVKTDNSESSQSKKVSPNFSEFKYEEKSENTNKEDSVKSEKEDSKEEKSENKDDEKKVNESVMDYIPKAGFIRDENSNKKEGAFFGQGNPEQIKKAKIIAKVKYAQGDRFGRVSKDDLDNFDEYYAEYKRIFGKSKEIDEDFKSGLKKAGKFAKGAIAGAAMAGALAGNAHGMEDPYYDGATRPYEDSYEQVQDEKPMIKNVKSDGTIVDQYGNEWTREEFERLMKGEDPYSDGATQPFEEASNTSKRKINVKIYGKDTSFNSRDEAIEYFETALSSCDPESSEYKRYEYILDELKAGEDNIVGLFEEDSDKECNKCEDEKMKRIKNKHEKLKKDFSDYKNKQSKELDKEELFEKDDELEEDTVKSGSGWTNKGKEGTHGKFKTKKAADAQRKAMFANGYKVSECNDTSEFDDEINETLRIAGVEI